MNATPPVQPTAPPADRHLGGVPHLLVFLLVAVVLVLVVQTLAATFALPVVQRQHPDLSLEQAYDRLRFNAFFAIPVQVVYSVLLVAVLYVFVRRRGLPFWQGLAFHRVRPAHAAAALAVGVILSFLVRLASFVVPPPEQLPFDKLFSSQPAALLVIAASLLLAPLIEEMVFRGYIYTLLERLWGIAPAVLISGLLFGAIHFAQLYPGFFQIFLLCVVGWTFSYVRASTGSVFASILAHLGYNAAISAGFLLSPQFRTLPAFF